MVSSRVALKNEESMMKKFIMYVSILCVFLLTFTNTSIALTITPTDDADTLTNIILGSGITVSNLSYTGAPGASGTFTGGMSSGIGIDSGIILTSGSAATAVGPNDQDGATTINGLAGDADLNALIPNYTTYDATILEFDFESAGGDIFFNYAFASEEYNEFTNSSFNDVFAFFLDGSNIALIPGTTTPVSINNVNGGNPLGEDASNPEFFNNNDLNDGGPFFSIQYDGFTDVFIASFLGLAVGNHHIKLAIADAGDYSLDSAVFIQAGTFSDKETPVDPVPEPATIFLLGLGLLGIVSIRRKN